MLTDPRQIGEVLEHARRVAEREEPRPNSPEDVGFIQREEPKGPPVAKCRSCSEPVYWCVTGTGAAMPVNVAPTPTGNLSLRWNGERVLAVYVDEHFQGIRRVSHFATCKHADKHRKSR